MFERMRSSRRISLKLCLLAPGVSLGLWRGILEKGGDGMIGALPLDMKMTMWWWWMKR
jgi:hypothetical protein